MVAEYKVELKQVAPERLAAMCGRVKAPDAATEMRSLVRQVQQHLGSEVTGPVIALYEPDNDGEVEIEAGIRADRPYKGEGPVHGVETPSGEAAYTTFTGGIEDVTSAHAAVQAWCKEQGRTVSGMNWEIYEQWSADGKSLQGAVYYLLRS